MIAFCDTVPPGSSAAIAVPSHALLPDGSWSAKRAWELGILRYDDDGEVYWHGEWDVILDEDGAPIALDDW